VEVDLAVPPVLVDQHVDTLVVTYLSVFLRCCVEHVHEFRSILAVAVEVGDVEEGHLDFLASYVIVLSKEVILDDAMLGPGLHGLSGILQGHESVGVSSVLILFHSGLLNVLFEQLVLDSRIVIGLLESSVQEVVDAGNSLADSLYYGSRDVWSTVHERVVHDVLEDLVSIAHWHVGSRVSHQVLVFIRYHLEEARPGVDSPILIIFIQLYAKNYIKSSETINVFGDRYF